VTNEPPSAEAREREEFDKWWERERASIPSSHHGEGYAWAAWQARAAFAQVAGAGTVKCVCDTCEGTGTMTVQVGEEIPYGEEVYETEKCAECDGRGYVERRLSLAAFRTRPPAEDARDEYRDAEARAYRWILSAYSVESNRALPFGKVLEDIGVSEPPLKEPVLFKCVPSSRPNVTVYEAQPSPSAPRGETNASVVLDSLLRDDSALAAEVSKEREAVVVRAREIAVRELPAAKGDMGVMAHAVLFLLDKRGPAPAGDARVRVCAKALLDALAAAEYGGNHDIHILSYVVERDALRTALSTPAGEAQPGREGKGDGDNGGGNA
jgi:hypothetical protein